MSILNLEPVEKIDQIDQKTFKENHFQTLKPVVITEMARSWPALTKWTPDFFKKNHGDIKVKVYNDSFVKAGKNYMSNAKTISFKSYVDTVLSSSEDLRMFLYNIKSEIPELMNDIKFPTLVSGISKQFVFMFFGCKGSITQLHFDIDMSHVFHTVMYGKRTVYLFPYDQGKNLHRYPFTCRSYVDVEKPDLSRFPGLKDVEGYKVELTAGDTLYIPSGYWHHFVYDEAGYALSFRCANKTVTGMIHGIYNLFTMQMIDRLMNKVTPAMWFNWKERRALKAC